MKVDRSKVVTTELGGETYYFCSDHCLHAFEAEPGKYLHADPATDPAHAGHAHH